MQHCYHTQLQSFVAPELVQGVPGRSKQCIVHQPGLMQCQPVKLLGQGKHYMIIGTGQQVCFPLANPLFAFVALALRAVPVAAAIVTDVHRAARITRIYMTA